MNKSNAHLYLPLVQALAEGKTIQHSYGDGQWGDLINPDFGLPASDYRVKPLSFPPIPEGMTLHNPDGLTAEQVGDGWRLLTIGEVMVEGYQCWNIYESPPTWRSYNSFTGERVPERNGTCSVRVPIQTPFPDGSRIVDGKLVKPWVPKFKVGDRVNVPEAGMYGERIKDIPCDGVYGVGKYGARYTEGQIEPAPWTLTRHIPGFRPLRDGEEWMAKGWTEDKLPSGTRPLIIGESYSIGSAELLCGVTWEPVNHPGTIQRVNDCFIRTRLPLPEPPKLVPLGPSDVPWGSAVRMTSQPEKEILIIYKDDKEIKGWVFTWTYELAVDHLEILRPGQTDWQACSKTA